MTLRTTATFDGKYEEVLKAWADKEYRSTGNLVSGIVNSVIDGNPMKVPEEISVPKESGSIQVLQESLKVLQGAFLSLVKAGDFDGFSVAELSHILGCEPSELDALVDCMSPPKKETQSKKRSPKS